MTNLQPMKSPITSGSNIFLTPARIFRAFTKVVFAAEVLLCLPQCTEGFTELFILITENLTSFVSPYKSQAFTKGRRGWGQSYYVNIKDKCIPVHEHRIHHIHLKRDLLSKHPAVFQIESV